ncbi:MAG: NmrA family NAD(P)-binding protein [Pseudobdellovibrionaceae bacterium]
MKKSVLIVGASGTVGSNLVQILKAQGHQITATTSKEASQKQDGVWQVRVNLATGEGLKNAFDGIQRVFILSPAGYADQYAMMSPLIQEAKRRGVEKVVLMTAMGANAVDTAPMRRAEIELEKSGLNYNIIRPNWFLQNFNSFWLHGVLQGQLALPAGNAKTSFVDTRDVSEVVAKLLIEDKFNNQDLDLTGAESVTHEEVADMISSVTGKKVVYSDLDPAILKKTLLSFGLKEDYVDFMLLIFGFLKEGYNARLTDSVEKVLGRKPRTLREYTIDYKNSWA